MTFEVSETAPTSTARMRWKETAVTRITGLLFGAERQSPTSAVPSRIDVQRYGCIVCDSQTYRRAICRTLHGRRDNRIVSNKNALSILITKARVDIVRHSGCIRSLSALPRLHTVTPHYPIIIHIRPDWDMHRSKDEVIKLYTCHKEEQSTNE
jgi:hypothetical protein